MSQSLLSLLLKKRTDEEVRSSERIKQLIKTYPSIKVVGRGAVTVEPKDIHKSDIFQTELHRASKLVTE